MSAKLRKKWGKPKQSYMYSSRQEPLWLLTEVNQQRKTPGIPPGQFPENLSPVSTQSNQSWLHFVFASTVGGLLQTSFIIYNGEDRCFPL